MNKSVCIVIPCRNEEEYISKCLDSIINCDYQKHLLEVKVVDGQSTDKTLSIIEKYVEQYSWIQIIENTKRTTPYALNLGLKNSSAEIKIILGAHSIIYPDYVSECVKIIESDEKIKCAGGILENIYIDNISQVIGYAMSSSFGVGNAHFRTGNKEGFVDTVAFGAYKSDIFDIIGYFDEELTRNQDDEYNFRIIKSGFKIFLKQSIKAKYYVRASFSKLYLQYFQYGYWKVYVNKKHRTITTIRQLIPFFFVLFLILGLVTSILFKYALLGYISVICIYIGLSILFAFKSGYPLKNVVQIVYSFFILHFSYGIGYLNGLIDFFILKQDKPKTKNEKLSR